MGGAECAAADSLASDSKYNHYTFFSLLHVRMKRREKRSKSVCVCVCVCVWLHVEVLL